MKTDITEKEVMTFLHTTFILTENEDASQNRA